MFEFKTAGSELKPLFRTKQPPCVFGVLWLGGVLNKKQGRSRRLLPGLARQQAHPSHPTGSAGRGTTKFVSIAIDRLKHGKGKCCLEGFKSVFDYGVGGEHNG